MAGRERGGGRRLLLQPPLCTQGSPNKEELRWDPRGAQGPCGSAEKQLQLEQEKSSELKKQNLQLQQENIKVCWGGTLQHMGRASLFRSLSSLHRGKAAHRGHRVARGAEFSWHAKPPWVRLHPGFAGFENVALARVADSRWMLVAERTRGLPLWHVTPARHSSGERHRQRLARSLNVWSEA